MLRGDDPGTFRFASDDSGFSQTELKQLNNIAREKRGNESMMRYYDLIIICVLYAHSMNLMKSSREAIICTNNALDEL